MGVNGIYGLSGSGMDIESMVKVGMMSKQNEYDKMAQKFTKNEWMKADYIELNSKITTFNASTLSQYKMSNTMNAKGAESSSEAVKVSASSAADLMSHQVDVEKLSANAYLVGTNSMQRYAITSSEADQTSTKLADVLFEELNINSTNSTVYGKIARVDMTEDGRDNTSWSNPDGRVLTTQVFGKVDGYQWHRWERYDQYQQWNQFESWVQVTTDGDGNKTITASQAIEPADTTGWQKITTKNSSTYNDIATATGVTLNWQKVTTNEKPSDDSNWNLVTKKSLDTGDTETATTSATATNMWYHAKATSVSDSDNWNAYYSSTNPSDGETWKEVTKTYRTTTDTPDDYNGSNWARTNSNNGVISNYYAGTVSLDTVAFEFTIGDGTTKTDSDGNEVANEVTISYTYKDLLGDASTEGKTFVDLVADINKQTNGLNIKATYDADHDKFSFYNTKSGDENGIIITFGNDSNTRNTPREALAARNFFNNMGLYVSKNGTLYGNDTDGDGTLDAATETDSNALLFSLKKDSSVNGTNSFMGENGIMRVDGITYDDVVDNKLTVNGITYTAVKTTGTLTETKDANGNVTSRTFTPTEPAATVAVTQDTDAIIDKVKSFITDYNKLLADLYAKYDEKPNTDYKPLTQSQKDQMKDEQIEKWEEKAKAGLLYHDQTLGKIIMNMRDAIASSVEGVDSKYNSAFSLGISTTGIKGQLVLDEDKLKAALAEDPDAVYNVFAKLDSENLNDSAKSGVAQRLGDIFVSATKAIKERAGSSSDITEDSDLNNLLRNLQTKMSNFKKLMTSFEDALYKKYDAMESTIAKLGTQLNYIMGSTGQ